MHNILFFLGLPGLMFFVVSIIFFESFTYYIHSSSLKDEQCKTTKRNAVYAAKESSHH